MGQSPSSIRSRGSSFRSFIRRSKRNKSSLSHTFSLPPSEEYPELMNVNSATEEQLMTLPGVSRQLAREIVRHRQMIGRFKRVDDLALVSGIGAEKLERLRPEICTNSKRDISQASSCTHSLDSIRITSESKLCSVNSSSVFQLQCVPGLNQEIAANIVDYRNKNGPFKLLDNLIKVQGMDIIRLSTVKPYLSLELHKSESVEHLTNGHVNGWTETSLNESVFSNEIKTLRSPHRKSLSMPTKFPITLPNGFATAPVNDILDLLSAYSHRPIVEEVFTYERNGIRCCRLASWNLHQHSVEKITNPGVREVICRTILEYRLSIIAIQDVLEEASLRMLCEELNSPSIRRVREWRWNNCSWDYCMPDSGTGNTLGFLYERRNKHIVVEEVKLDQVEVISKDAKSIVDEIKKIKNESLSICSQVFLLCDKPFIIVNVQCKDCLSEEDGKKLKEIADKALASKLQLAFFGDFLSWKNVRCEYTIDFEQYSLLVRFIFVKLAESTEVHFDVNVYWFAKSRYCLDSVKTISDFHVLCGDDLTWFIEVNFLVVVGLALVLSLKYVQGERVCVLCRVSTKEKLTTFVLTSRQLILKLLSQMVVKASVIGSCCKQMLGIVFPILSVTSKEPAWCQHLLARWMCLVVKIVVTSRGQLS